MKQFVALSGLPRSGSTLLSALLDQNPDIHAEGNSAVCQLMWDLSQSCQLACKEQLDATYRFTTPYDLISQIPQIYYKDTTKPIVIDKCRSWTIPANVDLLNRFVSKDTKVIVLIRPIHEIVQSFVNLRKENKWLGNLEDGLLNPGSEPIMRSLNGVRWARENNENNMFIFITYDELVNDTQNALDKIYDHCGWEKFEHKLKGIINKHHENDEIYNLRGMHDVRPSINKRNLTVKLTKETQDQCKYLDDEFKDLW